MTTSWNELKILEDYQQGKLKGEERLLLEARLLVDQNLQEQRYWQQKSYRLIEQYGRIQMRARLCRIEKELFTKPKHKSFAEKIKKFFC